MRISIFNLNNKNTYKDEYYKIIKILNSKCILYDKETYTYFDFVDSHLFHHWKYRKTFLDCSSYMEFIGVSNNKKLTEDAFLNFLEFILNIQLLLESIKKYKSIIFTDKANSILFHNIPLIIESMGYQQINIDDKIYLLKQDLIYDDLLDLVPNDLYELITSYNLIENSGIKMKRIILNKIYNIMLNDIDKYKAYNNSIFISIKTVVTKMGIIGDIDKKYINLTNYKLRKYYDYCHELMTYLIKTEYIIKYKNEIKDE